MLLSCYIYDEDLATNQLVKAIFPFVKNIIRKKWASNFFFIRYADSKGRHIRLRFKGEKKLLQTKLKPSLISLFDNYPLTFVRYIPEVTRYGGTTGVEIAEEQFQASSTVVLTLLSINNNWSYNRALGVALQLHLGMVYSFGLDKKNAPQFFEHLVSYGHEKKYEKSLKDQKTTLIPYLQFLWNALEQKKLFEEVWFNEWLRAMKKIANKLKKAGYKNNQLHLLYEGYIHMTNNRLGVANIDEPFIAYILKQALK
jgi:thiopeptide-type bacteriocin biosynthesis protein